MVYSYKHITLFAAAAACAASLVVARAQHRQHPEPVNMTRPLSLKEGTTPASRSPVRYRITALGRSGTFSYRHAIIRSGEIVGTENDAIVLWDHESTHQLGGLPNMPESRPSAVNSSGHIVGASGNPRPDTAILWRDNKWQKLFPDSRFSGASGINDKDQIVGEMAADHSTSASGTRHADLWQNGKVTDLGTLSGGDSWAIDINASGQIVGTSDIDGFLWENGKMRKLPTLGGRQTEACGINDRGQIVGDSDTASGQFHAFLLSEGQMRDLGSPGPGLCEAWKINNAGTAVGSWKPENSDNNAGMALVWLDRKLYNLNDLIPAGSGWVLKWA